MASGETPSVSVVIPTYRRPDSVVAAVSSALGQLGVTLEVLVVVDGPDPQTVETLGRINDERLRVLVAPVNAGPGEARNRGIAAARGRYIALLDDDDLWRSGKLSRQLACVDSLPDDALAIVGCRVAWHRAENNLVEWPLRSPYPGERVGHYLFVRRRAGEGMLPTPTLLLSSALAKQHPFPTHFVGHEEWDWLLDLQAAGASIHMVMETLVDVDGRPRRGSVSQSSGWRRSLAWAQARRADLGSQAYAGFILNEVARGALLDGATLGQQLRLFRYAASARPTVYDLARFVARLVCGLSARAPQ